MERDKVRSAGNGFGRLRAHRGGKGEREGRAGSNVRRPGSLNGNRSLAGGRVNFFRPRAPGKESGDIAPLYVGENGEYGKG